jgi:hypothetical protein
VAPVDEGVVDVVDANSVVSKGKAVAPVDEGVVDVVDLKGVEIGGGGSGEFCDDLVRLSLCKR